MSILYRAISFPVMLDIFHFGVCIRITNSLDFTIIFAITVFQSLRGEGGRVGCGLRGAGRGGAGVAVLAHLVIGPRRASRNTSGQPHPSTRSYELRTPRRPPQTHT